MLHLQQFALGTNLGPKISKTRHGPIAVSARVRSGMCPVPIRQRSRVAKEPVVLEKIVYLPLQLWSFQNLKDTSPFSHRTTETHVSLGRGHSKVALCHGGCTLISPDNANKEAPPRGVTRTQDW